MISKLNSVARKNKHFQTAEYSLQANFQKQLLQTMTTQPLFELSLFGMIDVEQLNTLKTRLSGICGDATSNNSSFATWEVVFKAKSTPHLKTESETVKSKTKSTTKAAELNTLGISASHMQPVTFLFAY